MDAHQLYMLTFFHVIDDHWFVLPVIISRWRRQMNRDMLFVINDHPFIHSGDNVLCNLSCAASLMEFTLFLLNTP